jgi:hypothetical protein
MSGAVWAFASSLCGSGSDGGIMDKNEAFK